MKTSRFSRRLSFAQAAIFLTLLCTKIAGVQASILTSGNFQTGSPTPTLTIDAPLTFDIPVFSSAYDLIFDEWVTSDGASTSVSPSPATQALSYRINNGAVQTSNISIFFDNFAGATGDATPNDGRFIFSGIMNIAPGSTLTILPGSFTFGSNAGFNPAIPTSFSGGVFLTDPFLRRVSPTINAVPEPSYVAILVACAILSSAVLVRRNAAEV